MRRWNTGPGQQTVLMHTLRRRVGCRRQCAAEPAQVQRTCRQRGDFAVRQELGSRGCAVCLSYGVHDGQDVRVPRMRPDHQTRALDGVQARLPERHLHLRPHGTGFRTCLCASSSLQRCTMLNKWFSVRNSHRYLALKT